MVPKKAAAPRAGATANISAARSALGSQIAAVDVLRGRIEAGMPITLAELDEIRGALVALAESLGGSPPKVEEPSNAD